MKAVQEDARQLVKRLAAIVDPALRVDYVRHLLESADPEWTADLLTLAAHATEARDAEHSRLMLALCLALADDRSDELRLEVARAATARGQHATAALLQRANEPEAAEAMPVELVRGRPLTLGERKALARRRERGLIARVLRDPNPDVIRILLGNPALTEDDVLRLAAQRPVAPEVLREVFRTPRWAVRYRVRRAIVNNPFTPRDVGLQLVVHLNAQDARAVSSSGDLPAPLREVAARIAGLATLH